MQRLSGLDATFLYLETSNNHMHVAGVYVFDPTGVPGGMPFERVRELVRNRLHRLPPFRRRLVEVPFGLHHPVWVEDPAFDLDYHVRRAALPTPGDHRELLRFAGEVMGRPLDRRHPLWEMYVVEGLVDGHVAMITKTHHAAIDGGSGAELSVNLLDLTEDTVVYEEPEWQPEPIPEDSRVLVDALGALSRQPARLVDVIRRTIGTLARSQKEVDDRRDVLPRALFSAPRTSINQPITPHRRFATAELALDDIRKVRSVLGGTVNDVVLALCAGSLRSFLERGGELPEDPLVAMVPMSVRTEDQRGAMGNRVTNMFVALATDIADPAERLRAIQEATRQAKDQTNAIGAEALADWAEFAAPAVAARAARLYASMRLAERHRPLFNLTISNVPGPSFPLYSAGARLVAWYPMGPIFDGSGLNITVMSYMGVLHFGLLACPETVPMLDEIAAGLGDAMQELLAAAAAEAAPVAKKTASRARKADGASKPTKAAGKTRPKKATSTGAAGERGNKR